MVYEDLLLDTKDHIAIITLNVPEKLNALSGNMVRSLAKVTEDIARDDDVRVAIVTGAGRGFCSGADVSSMQSRGTGASQRSRFQLAQFVGYPHADCFPKLNKPSIAAINGPCVGGGLSLALSCDIRIASESAKFGVAQVSRALVPDFGLTYYLPLAVGLSNAMELMCTAELFDPARAERMGMVSKVTSPDELMDTAMTLATKIAKQAPISIELSKKMVWQSRFDSLYRQLDLETWASHICFATEDHQTSVQAFLNKQPLPEFKGR